MEPLTAPGLSDESWGGPVTEPGGSTGGNPRQPKPWSYSASAAP
jgi:hypothetical protein